MRPNTLRRLQAAVRAGAYDMTAHAAEEMAEDALDIDDIENAMLTGVIVRIQQPQASGDRYTVHGLAADGRTPVGVVCRIAETGRLVIITVYEVTEQ